jgi:hypothetical protein
MKSKSAAAEWVSIGEAGARLHLSYNQVLRLVMRGDLTGRREGSRWWVAADLQIPARSGVGQLSPGQFDAPSDS